MENLWPKQEESRIAEEENIDYGQVAYDLYGYVQDYIPAGQEKCIEDLYPDNDVDFKESDIRHFLSLYANKNLPDDAMSERYDKEIIDAIKGFFENKLHEKHITKNKREVKDINGFECEKIDDGNAYIFKGLEQEDLINLGASICQNIDRSLSLNPQGLKEALAAGETLRPQGAFGVSISGDKLIASIYNGQGNKELMEVLKKAVAF